MEAVVSVSQGALGPLLGKLNTLLADECTRLTGVRREIRLLRSELSNMRTALQTYAMLEDPGVPVKAWTSEVRELAYDIEDCIDKFLHHVGGDEDRGAGGIKEFFRRSTRQLKTLGSRRQIVGQIEELKARVVAVKEHRTSYKLDEVACGSASHAAVDPRLSALFAEEHQLVGIEGPRDDLMNWLLEGERASRKHRKVLSIVGFGGLGKTTLANEVYRHLKGQFQCAAFVSLSQKPNMEKILKDVISQLHGEKDGLSNIETWDEKRLITKSRELLQYKRYLIVIDDVWSISTWRTIKYVIMVGHTLHSIKGLCQSSRDLGCHSIDGAKYSEYDAAEAAIREEANVHPTIPELPLVENARKSGALMKIEVAHYPCKRMLLEVFYCCIIRYALFLFSFFIAERSVLLPTFNL